jgi:hypothetical protein
MLVKPWSNFSQTLVKQKELQHAGACAGLAYVAACTV